MNRRVFLKAVSAAPLAAWIPAIAETQFSGMAAMHRAFSNVAYHSGPYYEVVHPGWKSWFEEVYAADIWKREYRAWRVAQREGLSTESLSALCERVKAKAVVDVQGDGEIGTFQHVRFIEARDFYKDA